MADQYKDVKAGFLGVESLEPEREISEATAQRLRYYRRYLESGEYLTGLKFQQIDRQAGLWFYDGEVKVFMPVAESLRFRPEADGLGYVKINKLERTYTVLVTDVNEEEAMVTVSYRAAQEKERPVVEHAIDEALKSGRTYRSKAIVTKICDPRDDGISIKAYVDIGGVGTSGVLWIADWADARTPDLRAVTHVDDVIDVVVTGMEDRTYRGRKVYHVSRRDAIRSSWEGIDEKLAVGQGAAVICVSEPRAGSNYFLGRIDGIRDINCICLLPRGGNMHVIKDQRYKGRVITLDPEHKSIRIRILPDD